MSRTLLIWLAVLVGLAACDSDAVSTLEDLDVIVVNFSDSVVRPDGSSPADTGAPRDIAAADTGSAPGLDIPNTAPTFVNIPGIALDMGSTTTVELAGLFDDIEDPESALSLSWSSAHVALSELTNRVLLVVAPVDWSGMEDIEITVTDSGGLTASSTLSVEVREVTIVRPDVVTSPDVVATPDTGVVCPLTHFEVDAGTGVANVWLAGDFNDWAGSPDAGTTVLTDVDGDGVWSVDVHLAPGRYEYKFIIDGTWVHDETNPARVDDTYGGYNSVLEVPACEG